MSPYLSEKSSDFGEILYTAADFELDERHLALVYLSWGQMLPPQIALTDTGCVKMSKILNFLVCTAFYCREAVSNRNRILTLQFARFILLLGAQYYGGVFNAME